LEELEREGMLFRKMWRGNIRLFKNYYCRLDVLYWRKCPDYYCVAEGDPQTPVYCPYKEKIKNDLHRKYWHVEKEEK